MKPPKRKRRSPTIKFIDLSGRTVMTKEAPQKIVNSINSANRLMPIALTIGDRSFQVDASNPALLANRGLVIARELDPESDFTLVEPKEIVA